MTGPREDTHEHGPGRWGRGGRWRGDPWPGGGRGPGPWRHDGPGGWRGPRRGFGCLFGVVFLVVAASMLAAATIIFTRLGLVAGVVTFLVVIGALIGVARTFRRTGRQLDALVDATRRVEAGDYTVRVGTPVRAGRSMRDLSRGFDTMVERLEVDERQRRELLADVSHELRTPLTVIAGDLEASIQPAEAVADPAAAALERARVERDLAEAESWLAAARARLANEAFTSKAPPAVVEGARAREAELADQVERLLDRLGR